MSQDIEPGSQVQGMLESKQVVVDYATGLFHYKVPLYTFCSGGVKLPITLDYTAKGIRQEDKSGLLGYNWTLNTGGVVTRTIRGGIADEAPHFGYLGIGLSSGRTPLEDDTEKVNKRERDGESDIFTVVFNGQTVHFIICLNENGEVCAEPLDRTSVRIKCEFTQGTGITGWVVTDENGNRYIYRQKEWTNHILREDAISFNGIRDKSYISAWYLNRVEPLNGRPIVFRYREEVREWDEEQENIIKERYMTEYNVKYQYGKPMRERPLDFSKYKEDFIQAIDLARKAVGDLTVDMQITNCLNDYLKKGGAWLSNPSVGINSPAINMNYRIMGQLVNLRQVGSASSELVSVLSSLVCYYRNLSSPDAQRAASYLDWANSCVMNSINEVNRNLTTKEVSNLTTYVILSPILVSIQGTDRVMTFQYSDGEEKFIRSIQLKNALQEMVSCVQVDRVGDVLNELFFLDKNEQVSGRLKFDYYPFPENKKLEWDIWGYRKGVSAAQPNPYDWRMDTEATKSDVLRSITLVNGGKIHLDYEGNEVFRDEMSGAYIKQWGGIRVKSVVLEDATGEGNMDSILYAYPDAGLLVENYVQEEAVNYGTFCDVVKYARMKPDGFTFLTPGNNSIYYPYVQEKFQGKGMNAYLFLVSRPSREGDGFRYPYAFWMNGLPLAEAKYDNAGRLIQLTKKRYYVPSYAVNLLNDYFFDTRSLYLQDGDTLAGYNKILPQMKAYEYYTDQETVEEYYRSQGTVQLCASSSFNPYEEIYLPNILPRTNSVLPFQAYSLYYGGKVLLKEQLEFRFVGSGTGEVSSEDFVAKTTGIPFRHTEYFYDNLSVSVHPTRVVSTDSRGDVYTRVVKRVLEMSELADPFVGNMKEVNLVLPVVKESILVNDVLRKESVTTYEVVERDTSCYVGPVATRCYYPMSTETAPLLLFPDESLYSNEISSYVVEKEYRYDWSQGAYLLTEESNRSLRTAYRYDSGGNSMILKAQDVSTTLVGAVDCQKYAEAVNTQALQNSRESLRNTLNQFYRIYLGIDPKVLSPVYQQYRMSPGHDAMLTLIELVASDKVFPPHVAAHFLEMIRANDYYFVHEFITRYGELFENRVVNIPPYFNVVFKKEMLFFTDPIIVNENFFNGGDVAEEAFLPSMASLSLDARVGVPNLSLYVLYRGNGRSLSYTVSHDGGTATGNVSLASSSIYGVQVFPIDMRAYTGVTAVSISAGNLKGSKASCVVLVPEGTVFEAMSYNLDGTIFCKFDHTGQVELYEYDAASRLIRVRDQEGKVVRENDYNVIIE